MEQVFDVFESAPFWAQLLMFFGIVLVVGVALIAACCLIDWLLKPSQQLHHLEETVKNIDKNVMDLCNKLDAKGEEE